MRGKALECNMLAQMILRVRPLIATLCFYCSLTMNNPLEGVTGLPEEQKRRLEDAIEQMQVRDR